MFARYVFKDGSYLDDVMSDIIALFTGTTDLTQLSAACDADNSAIIATEPAGWTVETAGVFSAIPLWNVSVPGSALFAANNVLFASINSTLGYSTNYRKFYGIIRRYIDTKSSKTIGNITSLRCDVMNIS